jgi:hypothetical protein
VSQNDQPYRCAKGDRELRRAKALASLRDAWRRAEVSGNSTVCEEDIEAEIDRIRKTAEDQADI